MKVIIRIVVSAVLLFVVYFLTVIIVATISKYRPDEVEQISIIDEDFYLNDSTVYSALIWNIGYGGLGAEMDFFYDGGVQVRDSEDNVRRNIYKVTEFLKSNDTIDFIMLQEVDEKSKRSYKLNVVEHLNVTLAEHFPFFAYNYKVGYVPIPIKKPLGKVNSGLLTFSKHIPVETQRHAFPGNFAWPTSIFMLDRCFLTTAFKVANDKEFVLINTHNSAYDDGSLRQEQMAYLKNYLIDKSGDGNTFMVGGDWNQCPPDFQPEYVGHVFDTVNKLSVEDDFLANGWEFVYEPGIPTNRRLMTNYVKGLTPVTTIDYFLSSAGIEIESVKTIDLDFVNSDHQPVIVSFSIK